MRWQWQSGCDFGELRAAAALAPAPSGLRVHTGLERLVYVPYHMARTAGAAVQHDFDKRVLRWDDDLDAIVLGMGDAVHIGPAAIRDALPGAFLRLHATAVVFAPRVGAEYQASVLQAGCKNGSLPRVQSLVHDWVPCSVANGTGAYDCDDGDDADQPSTSGAPQRGGKPADFARLEHGERIIVRLTRIDKHRLQVQLHGIFVRSLGRARGTGGKGGGGGDAVPSPFKPELSRRASRFAADKLDELYGSDLTVSQPDESRVKAVLKFDQSSESDESDDGGKGKQSSKRAMDKSEVAVKVEANSTPAKETERRRQTDRKEKKRKRKHKDDAEPSDGVIELDSPRRKKTRSEDAPGCSKTEPDVVVVEKKRKKKKKHKRGGDDD